MPIWSPEPRRWANFVMSRRIPAIESDRHCRQVGGRRLLIDESGHQRDFGEPGRSAPESVAARIQRPRSPAWPSRSSAHHWFVQERPQSLASRAPSSAMVSRCVGSVTSPANRTPSRCSTSATVSVRPSFHRKDGRGATVRRAHSPGVLALLASSCSREPSVGVVARSAAVLGHLTSYSRVDGSVRQGAQNSASA
jgi:hypothetical protein